MRSDRGSYLRPCDSQIECFCGDARCGRLADRVDDVRIRRRQCKPLTVDNDGKLAFPVANAATPFSVDTTVVTHDDKVADTHAVSEYHRYAATESNDTTEHVAEHVAEHDTEHDTTEHDTEHDAGANELAVHVSDDASGRSCRADERGVGPNASGLGGGVRSSLAYS